MSTFVTLSLNVTRKLTLVAFVGLALAGTIDRTNGAVVSTSTPVVSGSGKLKSAALLAASRMVPPLRRIGEMETMPSVSVSPATTV